MKIKSIYVPDFMILNDFKIEFEVKKNLAVIIGDNGSGKSTLLEVIAYIFGHLHKYFVLGDKTAEFIDKYEIEFYSIYRDRQYKVYLKSVYVNQKTNTFKPIIKIDDEEISISNIDKLYGGFKNFLPSRIAVYYAGEANYLRTLCEHFESKFINEIIKDKNPYSLVPLKLPVERPFYYIKKQYLGIILTSLLANTNDNQIIQFLGDMIGDVNISNAEVKIVLKKPEWANKRNDNLWGINSKLVEQFIDKLNVKANYVDSTDTENEIAYSFFGTIDLIPLFNEFSAERDFSFILLDTLLFNGILSHISVDFKLKDGSIINSERLSEGQRQFIVTGGLGILWKAMPNKLFLYDEPDVFLHPKWQRKYIPFIQDFFDNSFALITTHNPSLVSDVKREQVFLFRYGKIIHKSMKTYGQKLEQLFIDYFGLDSTRNIESSELFDSLYLMIEKKQQYSLLFIEQYKRLENIVGKDDNEFLLLTLELRRADEKNR